MAGPGQGNATGSNAPLQDTDDNGVRDWRDDDDDGDGVPTAEGEDADGDGDPTNDDMDGDGTPDYLDPDLPPDADGDGVSDDEDVDDDGDGILDTIEGEGAADIDGDAVPDHLDIDSDGDGIVDNIEGQSEEDYVPPSGLDSDGDGLDDAYDSDAGGTPIAPIHSDGDTAPDLRDLDSDDDNVPDATEGHDANHDGIPDTVPLGADSDGDGLDDAYDTVAGPAPGNETGSNAALQDTDGDATRDWRDDDDDGDGIPTAGDEDADGDGDPTNDDSDGDGIPDYLDRAATDDADGDGIVDEDDLDDDNDGILDSVEDIGDSDVDGDGLPDRLDIDSDGDGILDNIEAQAEEDYVARDADSDDDNVPDSVEGHDADHDGVPDVVSIGFDGDIDGLDDAYDTVAGPAPGNETGSNAALQDTDGDATRDWRDDDDDGDGIPTAGDEDADGDGDPTNDDSDGDGTPDYLDPDPTADADADGIPDHVDIDDDGDGILDALEATGDTDGDGLPDELDIDADGDGIVDNVEAQTEDGYVAPSGVDTDGDGLDDAYDDSTGGSILIPVDTDGDTVFDCRDGDSDDDNVPDTTEGHDANHDGAPDVGPTGTDSDADGLDDAYDTVEGPGPGNVTGSSAPLQDTDDNGTRDWRDDDDDGDGIPTAGAEDADGDGDPTNDDSDGDGTPDYLDRTPTGDADGDGVPDVTDIDDDNDGILDAGEGGGAVDSDGDGIPDSADIDSDGDGIVDNVEAQEAVTYVPPSGIDTDGDGLDNAYDPHSGGTLLVPVLTDADGLPDVLDPDSDDDNVPDAIEGHDANHDGAADATPAGLDTDDDGLDDAYDTVVGPGPGNAIGSNAPLQDTDGNAIRDWRDDDDDGDGVPTAGDEDANGDGDPTNDDGDGDGTPDYLDPDSTEDTDGDGVPDVTDVDDDNDGVVDEIENAGPADTDGDGVPAAQDIDSDGDGIVDNVEAQAEGAYVPPAGTDADGDGLDAAYDSDEGGTPLVPIHTDTDAVSDLLDIDSDGDNVPDATEGHDADHDGVPDAVPTGSDADSDGLDDAYDTVAGPAPGNATGSNAPIQNTDADAARDWRDDDDDGDGIPTAGAEDADADGDPTNDDADGDGTPDYLDDDPTDDADGDGLPNTVDIDDDNDGILDATEAAGPTDPDGDGLPSSLDIDSDGDGVVDNIEGQPDAGYVAPSGSDGDGDGLDDAYDPDNGGTPIALVDTDGDTAADVVDADSDDDNVPDSIEGHDADHDGLPDAEPTGFDADGDGLDDAYDTVAAPGPGNPTGSNAPLQNTDGDTPRDWRDDDDDGDGILTAGAEDADGDGDPTNDDADGDGTPDYLDADPTDDADGDGIPDTVDIDDDSDGLTDADEGNGRLDTDADGVPDDLDIDSDGDGIVDNVEGQPDLGYIEPEGTDTDGDGLDDAYDTDSGGTPIALVDTDGDATPDCRDLDSDDDNVPDATEGHDANHDGAPDALPTGADVDGDGLDDAYDTVTSPAPGNATGSNASLQDTDGDAARDWRDDDDDGDGTATAGAEDADGDGDPTNDDADGDGVPDYLDGDPPIEPPTTDAILLRLVAAKKQASVGDIVAYTLVAANTLDRAVEGITLHDRLPSGFKFVEGSGALVRGGHDAAINTPDDERVPLAPAGDRTLVFGPLDFEDGEPVKITYLLRIGAGVLPGEHRNSATPHFGSGIAGNTASATVVVTSDPLLESTTIVGKVFHDRDGDGWQEPAYATGLHVVGGLDEDNYVPNSTSVDYGNGPVAIGDGSVPLARGIDLDDLPGRCGEHDPPEHHRVVVRAGLRRPEATGLTVTTAEGTSVTIDPKGRFRTELRGASATGSNAQIIVVTRDVVPTPGGHAGAHELRITIENHGIEEEGIPGVRLATPAGLVIETDSRGRYHIADVDAGRFDRGRNAIVKVDPTTLPSGAEFTTENPRVLRITHGLMSSIDFGVKLPEESAAKRPQGESPADDAGVDAGADAEPDTGSPPTESSIERNGPAHGISLPGSGVVWATEDAAVSDPRLDVAAPGTAEIAGGRLVEPVRFNLYSNYGAFVDRWEISIGRRGETGLAAPLKVLSGDAIGFGARAEWSGDTDAATPLRAGDELVYVLKVYDGDGRVDETKPRTLRLTDGAASTEGSRGGTTADAGDAIVHGTSNLARRSIPIAGSRVRVHGTGIPDASELRIAGERVPVDPDGRFAVEMMLPPGRHSLAVEMTDGDGGGWADDLVIDVRDRYSFLVGIASLTVGEGDAASSLESRSSEGYFDSGSFVDGRLAFYLRGRFLEKYLVTAQMDTGEDDVEELFRNLDRRDPRAAFRHLDPDRFYLTYGDDSTTFLDTDSQGKFYARVDWDDSRALWGNYNTSLTGTEYGQYNRTLYGAMLRLKTAHQPDGVLRRVEATAFGAEAQTAFAHNEFRATGGSLYYLRDTDVVRGSEKITVEVRDRATGRTLESVALVQGRDYEIDEMQGRVILSRPLTQTADRDGPSIIKDLPLDGSDVLLLIDYEYVPDDLDLGDATYGGRAKGWVAGGVALGGTYVREERDGADYQLVGADLTLETDRGSYIKCEYATSEARQTPSAFVSYDGGLSFGEMNVPSPAEDVAGDAFAVESRLNLADVTGGLRGALGAWWRQRDAGFSVARLAESTSRVTEYGALGQAFFGESLSVLARGAVVEREGNGDDSTYDLEVDYRFLQRWTLGGAMRHETGTRPGSDDTRGTLGALRLGYDVTSTFNVYGTSQLTLDRTDNYVKNDMATLGLKALLYDDLTIRGEASTGDRGKSVDVGADYALSNLHTLYGTYVLSTDRVHGERGVFTVGERGTVSDQLRVFTEHQFAHEDGRPGIMHVYGADFIPNGRATIGASLQTGEIETPTGRIERNVGTLSLSYQRGRTRVGSMLEYRWDDGAKETRQWVTTNALSYRAHESLTATGKFSLSRTEDVEAGCAEAEFAETGLSVAYRPVGHNRVSLLGKYSYLYDLPSRGQDEGDRMDERSHVLSLEAIRAFGRHWELGGKLAHKRGEVRMQLDTEGWIDTRVDFAALRARWHIRHDWDALAEYRWLRVRETKDHRRGALLAIYRGVTEHLKVGIGYNFTEFNDDLTDLDEDRYGWFLDMVATY